MADLTEKTPGEVLADSSVAEFIKELGLGIAAAQAALDDNSIRQIDAFTTAREDLGGRTLLDLGLSPAFYHYQHADITCSMQVRMEVGKSDEFGFGVRAGINDQTSSEESDGSSDTSTESSARRGTLAARMTMRSDSDSVLSLAGGTTVTPTGTTPLERLADLRDQLAAGDSGINRLIATPPDTRPEMTLNGPATDKVVISSPSVAFLGADNDSALIRIRSNTSTDFAVNGSLTVETIAQADLEAYATHVAAEFTDAGFTYSKLFAQSPRPGVNGIDIGAAQFDTNVDTLRTSDALRLTFYARLIRATGAIIKVEGFTDRQGRQSSNIPLGERRAKVVYEYLLSQGLTESQIRLAQPSSRGEAEAERQGDDDGLENQIFRLTTLTILNEAGLWLSVSEGPEFAAAADITPSAIGMGTGGPDNAYMDLWDPQPLGLSGNGVTIDGTDFPFSGAPVSGGGASGSAVAHAQNLTTTINATATHRAWTVGNVVRVARAEDTFDIQLFATTSRDLRIAESSGFTLTTQFTRTTSRVQQRDQEANRTIAVGATVDGRFSRQFNTTVTGNSTISARLVSVPAPIEFLSQIKDYQNELE